MQRGLPECLDSVGSWCTSISVTIGDPCGRAGAVHMTDSHCFYLNLSYNDTRDAGTERLSGVLGQCASLTYLNFSDNNIGSDGKGRLRASWCCQTSGLVLEVEDEDEDEDEV